MAATRTLELDQASPALRARPEPAAPVRPAPLASLQRLAGNSATTAAVQRDEQSPVLDVVGRGGGTALPEDVQRDMGAALGADLSGVRIHTGGGAAASAEAVGAKAYTTGNEIVFGAGAFDPASTDGRRTLAHELTHVVQQSHGPVAGTDTGDGISVSDPSDSFEREAVAHAEHVVEHGHAPGVTPAAAGAPPAVQRHGADHDDEPVQLVQRELPEEEEEVQA